MSKISKILIIFILGIFLISSVSAFSLNGKDYNEKDKEVVISKYFGFGKDVANIKLITPLNYYLMDEGNGVIQKVAEVELNNYDKNYNNALKDINLYNIKNSMSKFNRDYEYRYRIKNGTKEEFNYTNKECLLNFYKNISVNEFCYKEVDDFTGWVRFTDIKELPKESVRIGIFTDVKRGEKVEWIPEWFGVKIKEWANWDVSDAVYEGINLTTQGLTPVGIFFKPDGTKLYQNSLVPSTFYQYNCSIPWKLNSCSYETSLSSAESGSTGMYFKPDGTKLYDISFFNDKFHQYNCSVPWNLSSCIYELSLNTHESGPFGMFMKIDGTKLYEIQTNAIHQFNCLIPWNLSSCSYELTKSSTPSLYLIYFRTDGIKLYKDSNNIIYQYNCSNPWDLNYCNYENKNFVLRGINNRGFAFDINGTKLYSLSQTDKFIYQYSLFNYSNITLNSPENNSIITNRTVNFNCSITSTDNILNLSVLIDNISSITTFNSSFETRELNLFNSTNVSDGIHNWTCYGCSDIKCIIGESRNFTVEATLPTINLTHPRGVVSDYFVIGENLTINWTVYDEHLDSCWYEYNGINTSAGCHDNYTIFTPLFNKKNLTFYANDTYGNLGSNLTEWTYKVFQVNVSSEESVFEGELLSVFGNFSLYKTPSNIQLIYNNISYNPFIRVDDNDNYIINTTLNAPVVSSDQNFSYYYLFDFNGDIVTTNSYNQTVLNIEMSTNCSGNYLAFNISNADELTLQNITGNLTYRIRFINQEDEYLAIANGTVSSDIITFCTNLEVNTSNSFFDLRLIYNSLGYTYKSYNNEKSPLSLIPQTLYLYYLNETKSTEFRIIYTDYTYYKHPGAIIQIQKEYLDENLFRIVEIPLISDDGTTTGSFETTNIRYKLIVIENGEILDIFENVFPKCQSLVYGTCEINLHGSKEITTIVSDNLEYEVTQGDNSITITYIIPDGSSRVVTLITNQSSRFLDDVSSCQTSLFSSGGTLTCTYNNTVGDSIIDTQILVDDINEAHGKLLVTQPINDLFLANNYFISFILLLTLALIFIGSATIMVISATIGLFYLGFVFLIRNNSINVLMIGTSIAWLIIAIGLAIYKIAQKQERTT